MRRRTLAALGLTLLVGCAEGSPTALRAPWDRESARALPPNAPVVFLHYDYMVQDTPDASTPAHSDAPNPQSLDTLVQVFRRHGIEVVIDPKHTALPHQRLVQICDDAALAGVRAQYFMPHGNQAWHYVIFGHALQICGQGPASGVAEVPGFNLMVAVGVEFHEPGRAHSQCADDFGSYNGLCVRIEAGTLLHELGHNLGLYHGGDQDEPFNYKPNYLSVMNYGFQRGIPHSAVSGATDIVGYRLDYSDRALPNLDESHLDERVGLGGPPGSTDLSFYDLYVCADPGDPTTCGFAGAPSVPVTGPIDWNQNGVIEPDVQYDVSYLRRITFGSPIPQFYPLLTGFDDWAHINAFLRTPAYVNGTLKAFGLKP